MVTTFENSCFTHTRNQMHEVLSKPMGKMTATHISPNTRTGKKSSLSNSDFNDSSQNNSISKAHTSGSNVVLASPSQPTAYRPNSFQRHSHSWGKNSFNVALNQTRYWHDLIWDEGGSSYLMELSLQQTLLHWFTQSLCFQSYACKQRQGAWLFSYASAKVQCTESTVPADLCGW